VLLFDGDKYTVTDEEVTVFSHGKDVTEQRAEIVGETDYYCQLMVNNAAGDFYFNQCAPSEERRLNQGHYREAAYGRKSKMCEKIKELRGPVRYAVFFDRTDCDGFITQEDQWSGNWKGSKYGRNAFCGEFDTMKEAQKFLEDMRGN